THSGVDLPDSDALSQILHLRLPVSGKQEDPAYFVTGLEMLDEALTLPARFVTKTKSGSIHAVHQHQRLHSRGLSLRKSLEGHRSVTQAASAGNVDFPAVHDSEQSLTRSFIDLTDGFEYQAGAASRGYNGHRERMFGILFEAGGHLEDLLAVEV